MSERDRSDLHPAFHEYVGEDVRVKVETVYMGVDGDVEDVWVRCGRVGRSMGWRPVYLLMARRGSSGSSDVLSVDTERRKTRVIGVLGPGDKSYREVATPRLTASVGWWAV